MRSEEVKSESKGGSRFGLLLSVQRKESQKCQWKVEAKESCMTN